MKSVKFLSTYDNILTRLDSSGDAKLRSSTLTFTVRTPENITSNEERFTVKESLE